MKIINIAVTIFLIHGSLLAQSQSAIESELRLFTGNLSKKISFPREELSKVRSEMFFILFHIRDSAVNGVEVFAKSDTLLKKYIEELVTRVVVNYKFKSISNHDYVIPLVIKNSYPYQKIRDTSYDYLLWKNGKVKSPNKITEIYSMPLFWFGDSGPNMR